MKTKISASPFFAAILSFIIPGLGQLYCGYLKRATWFYVVFLCLLLSTCLVLGLTFYLLAMALGFWILLVILSGIDAYRVSMNNPEARMRIRLVLAILLLHVIILYAAVPRISRFATYRIPTTSMKPTLEMGERFIATKIGENREFQRGDIVVFEYTSVPHVVFVKRIIGLPGDLLSISEDTLRVNRSILHEPYVCFEKNGIQVAQDARNLSERTIPAGHVYVLSDNRYNGVDSRQYGPVSIDSIRGLASYVYLSNSARRIGFNLRRDGL